jgi:predicted DNA-binding protein (UPF0251 family)
MLEITSSDPGRANPASQVRRAGRPARTRIVAGLPEVTLFKPAGVPARMLERSTLTIDQFEAMRLVDGEGLGHDQAAAIMGVSRQTVGRIIESGRRTLIQAVAEGRAILIEGGAFTIDPEKCAERRRCQCPRGGRQGRRRGGPGCEPL